VIVKAAGLSLLCCALVSWRGQTVLAASPTPAAHAEQTRVLRGGWYPWYPYQYQENAGRIDLLTGLDVELVRAVLQRAGIAVSYEEVPWAQHQLDLESGRRDIAAGAVRNPEREAYAYFSAPYRTETMVLYVRGGEAQRNRFGSVPEMLESFRRTGFRLGIVSGFDYGPEVEAAMRDPAGPLDARAVGTDAENFSRLITRQIDGLLVDRLAGSKLAWQQGWHSLVEACPLVVRTADVHVMFSKKTTSPELVRAFDNSLAEMRRSGAYARLLREYRISALLSALSSTVNERWFFLIDVAGTIAFAISGLLLARKERYSLFGAFVLAALPAVGGGLVRDLIVGRRPIGVTRNPIYLGSVVATVLVGYLAFKVYDRLRREPPPVDPLEARRDRYGLVRIGHDLFEVFDAVGLAAFTVIGVVVAIEAREEPLWLWGPCLAALTAAGGGILRDVIRADPSNPGLKGSFYPEVPFLWGLLLALFLTLQPEETRRGTILYEVLFTLAGAFATRLLIVALGIRSPLMHDVVRNSPERMMARVEAEQDRILGVVPRLLDGYVEDAPPAGAEHFELRHGALLKSLASLGGSLAGLEREKLSEQASQRLLNLAGRQRLLIALEDGVYQLANTLDTATSSPSLSELGRHLAEALQATLLIAGDALRSGRPEDFEELARMTSDRNQALGRVRSAHLDEPALGRQERTVVFQMTSTLERIVWMLRRLAELRRASS